MINYFFGSKSCFELCNLITEKMNQILNKKMCYITGNTYHKPIRGKVELEPSFQKVISIPKNLIVKID